MLTYNDISSQNIIRVQTETLVQSFVLDLLFQVVEKVKQADHEYSDYQFSLMLPVATILRQVYINCNSESNKL